MILGAAAMSVIERFDVPITVKNDNVELRTAPVGELTVGFVEIHKGTDMGPALVGLPGDLCQCPHWGYILNGRVMMRTADGEEIYEGGQVFYWPPGHAPVALEDSEYVDFSPTDEFAKVIRHITRTT
jgi:hypothetical protein